MLNKKAIAAFAAGATLLSGFAFAAPAMAVKDNNPCKGHTVEWCTVRVQDAQGVYDAAFKAVNDKKDGYLAKYNNALADYNAKLAARDAAFTTLNNLKAELQAAQGEAKTALEHKVAVAQDEYNAAVSALTAAKTAKDDAEAELRQANAVLASDLADLNQKKADLSDFVGPTEDEVKRALINKVRLAKMNLDNKDDLLAVAKKNFDDAYKALVAAVAEYNARENAATVAHQKLNAFLASGVNDSTTETRLRDAADRADAHLKRATIALAKAKAAYDDALAKDLAAVAAYNKALQAYKDVYNEAVAAGVNPALLPPVVTSDPLDPKVPAVPGLKHAYASAMSGKFGKEAKAASQKGKDTKASAQQNSNANGAAAGA
ncbi:hypothetical protein CJI50_04230, partial [Bifidobacteriaceae bacterium NR021]